VYRVRQQTRAESGGAADRGEYRQAADRCGPKKEAAITRTDCGQYCQAAGAVKQGLIGDPVELGDRMTHAALSGVTAPASF